MKILSELNESLKKSLAPQTTTADASQTTTASASVSVLAASKSSITFREKLAKPIVIGYLAFDMEIGRGGILGAPIPTLATLKRQEVASFNQTFYYNYLRKDGILRIQDFIYEEEKCSESQKAKSFLALLNEAAYLYLKKIMKIEVNQEMAFAKFDELRANIDNYQGKTCKQLLNEAPRYNCKSSTDLSELSDNDVRFPNLKEQIEGWIQLNKNLIQRAYSFAVLLID